MCITEFKEHIRVFGCYLGDYYIRSHYASDDVLNDDSWAKYVVCTKWLKTHVQGNLLDDFIVKAVEWLTKLHNDKSTRLSGSHRWMIECDRAFSPCK